MIGQGARFLAAGALNTALTYALYCILVLWLPAQLAYAIVFALGIGLAYLINARFVFGAELTLAGAAGYPLVYLATYATNAALIEVLTRAGGIGPRVALAGALLVSTPLSFALNRYALGAGAPAMRRALAFVLPLVAVGAAYARGFGGFFHGDDFANLGQAFAWTEQGVFWPRLAATFVEGNAAQGAFWRPLQLASLYLNYRIAGTDYAGWYAINFALHLANVALVGALVRRLARECGVDALLPAALAMLWFGLFAPLAEGVFWVCARADAIVTLLGLAATYQWVRGGPRAVWLPLLVAPALATKESAAVLPLQLALLVVAWPALRTRSRMLALLGSFALVVAFLGGRAWLFGSAWQVYGSSAGPLEKLLAACASLPAWWRAIQGPTLALLLVPVAAACAWPSAASAERRIGLAALGAVGGLLLATALNLGALDPAGEGGRLTYAPAAWLALALGVLLARARAPGLVALGLAVALGMPGLIAQLATARAAQDQVRAVVAGVSDWAARNAGASLLVVPERIGPVVALRNAQGGATLPPIQLSPLLDRVLPTLPAELDARHAQLGNGLLTRLRALSPRYADAATIARALEPAQAAWPEHYACWSLAERRFVALPAPRHDAAAVWRADLADALAREPRCAKL